VVAIVKRSNAPVFWVLFGAGGMLAALFGPVLVLITGIATPLGVVPPGLLSYARMLALARHWSGKALLFLVIALFAWHAMHRIFHSLHDLGMRTGTVAKLACYGGALVITVVSALSLLALGF
jgi:succinate dehydrogenase subunit D